MTEEEAKQAAADIKYGEEWWKRSGEETFTRLMLELVNAHGLTSEQASKVLNDAYYAAAEEFGG